MTMGERIKNNCEVQMGLHKKCLQKVDMRKESGSTDACTAGK